MRAFADDTSTVIEGLTIENGPDRISIYGDIDIPRDRTGVALIEKLEAIVDAIVEALHDDPALPDRIGPADKR